MPKYQISWICYHKSMTKNQRHDGNFDSFSLKVDSKKKMRRQPVNGPEETSLPGPEECGLGCDSDSFPGVHNVDNVYIYIYR